MSKGEKVGEKIVQSEEPLNLEMPFEKLEGFVTPTDLFYVRTHFPIPKIDAKDWRLQVDGAVEHPLSLSLDELTRMPAQTRPVTLECAGNNRSFLEPKVKGVQWSLGAVGNAEWTGVPLSFLLDQAGVKTGAIEIVLEGGDSGPLEDPKAPRGEIHFARSIPLGKGREDVVLAYKMNGAALKPEHGFPLRAIVPGWYAVASVKWLRRITVIERAFHGYYQTLDYAYWKPKPNGVTAELTPLTTMALKAQIAHPKEGETVATNSDVRVTGAAWTGEKEIGKVEVSFDGGATWKEADLIGQSQINAWRLWEFAWHTPSKSREVKIIARAFDSSGETQPHERDLNRGTYMVNHLLPVTVQVR